MLALIMVHGLMVYGPSSMRRRPFNVGTSGKKFAVNSSKIDLTTK